MNVDPHRRAGLLIVDDIAWLQAVVHAYHIPFVFPLIFLMKMCLSATAGHVLLLLRLATA